MRIVAALLLLAASATTAAGCASNLDCSLNGVCSAGACKCDAPWKGTECGVLGYKTTPISGKSLFPESGKLSNTWNGAILRGTDGVYHCYNPLFPAGELGGTTMLMHGTAANVTGPYNWGAMDNFITIPELGAFDGPKSVVYTEDGATKYSLWLGGNVYVAHSAEGPFVRVKGFRYPGHNPAPLFHNGSFYTITSMGGSIMTTPKLVSGAKWTEWTSLSAAYKLVPAGWLPEDPDMWVDRRGNWHIVNHCYDNHEFENCGTSVLSSHFFSGDSGKTWHFLKQGVQPYTHTVRYDDGSSHNFVTMERPNMCATIPCLLRCHSDVSSKSHPSVSPLSSACSRLWTPRCQDRLAVANKTSLRENPARWEFAAGTRARKWV